jgi:hypothetical protein
MFMPSIFWLSLDLVQTVGSALYPIAQGGRTLNVLEKFLQAEYECTTMSQQLDLFMSSMYYLFVQGAHTVKCMYILTPDIN